MLWGQVHFPVNLVQRIYATGLDNHNGSQRVPIDLLPRVQLETWEMHFILICECVCICNFNVPAAFSKKWQWENSPLWPRERSNRLHLPKLFLVSRSAGLESLMYCYSERVVAGHAKYWLFSSSGHTRGRGKKDLSYGPGSSSVKRSGVTVKPFYRVRQRLGVDAFVLQCCDAQKECAAHMLV
jgi:hypothetical protein